MGRKKILGEDSEMVSIRITKKQKASINLLVRARRYKDISQFVRKAIDGYLELENLEGARAFVEDMAKRIRVAEGEDLDE